MNIAFIIIFILVSQLIHMIAVHHQMGLMPFPFGVTIFSTITNIILLVTSIWYLGWIAGVILFLCHLFGIIHGTVGWVLVIPSLFYKYPEQHERMARHEVSLLTLSLIGSLVFCVISFFIAPFKSLYNIFLYHYTQDTLWNIAVVLGAVLVIGFICRIIVSSTISKNANH